MSATVCRCALHFRRMRRAALGTRITLHPFLIPLKRNRPMRYANWICYKLRDRTVSFPGFACLLLLAACVSFLLMTASAADDPVNAFQGEWRTTISTVKLEQHGDQ